MDYNSYERMNGAVEDHMAMVENAAKQAAASAHVGQEPKLRERLYEIEKLLSDSTTSIRDSADRLFGSAMLAGIGFPDNGKAPASAEPPLTQIIDRILNLTRANRDEAMRFNRIG